MVIIGKQRQLEERAGTGIVVARVQARRIVASLCFFRCSLLQVKADAVFEPRQAMVIKAGTWVEEGVRPPSLIILGLSLVQM